MPDFDKPVICEIAQSHLGFAIPRWWVSRIDHHVLVVIRAVQVVDPRVRGRDRMKRVVCSWR